jgi:hypothetical protein
MDQDAFRRTYRDVNERYCAYEKSVLTNECRCSQAERFCIAEREGVRCGGDDAQAQCLEVLALMREAARFALKAASEEGVLPHGKAMKIQVGGLRGIRAALEPDAPAGDPIDDVHGLLCRAREAFGSLAGLPYSAIMREVAAYQVKKRSRRK